MISHNNLLYGSFQPVLYNWGTKSCGICYHVCAMVHIKEPLLLLERVDHVVAAMGFLSCYLNGPLPYVRCHITIHQREQDVAPS